MTLATISDWLDRLQGVRKSGAGYKARCPAHDDKNPSLSVTEGAGDVVLVTCFAGCEFNDIRDALWPQGTDVGPSLPAQRRAGVDRGSTISTPRALPNGPHDTVSRYHYADGGIAFASVRHQPPGKAKRFSQWTPADGGLWFDRNPLKTLPLYRLPQIVDAERVVVVEGEKCVDAVLAAWPNLAVTTYAGGSKSWRKTDWSPLVGKDVSIWADADDDAPPDKPNAKGRGGQAAAREIAAHLLKIHCRVRLALPEPDGGADIADWLAVGKGHAKAMLDGLLRDYGPEPQPEEQPEKNEPGYREVLANNEYFRLLGLDGSNPVFRLKAASQMLTVKRKDIFNPNQLRSISGGFEKFWEGLLGGEVLNNRRASDLGSQLLEAADLLPQMDWSKVYGRGAVRLPGGRIVYHLGDRLLVDGEERPLGDETVAHVVGKERSLDDETVYWTAEPRIPLSDPATDSQRRAVAQAVMQYRWRTPMDGKRLLGWMVSAIVGGALEWRPHIQITAPSGHGKSWLLREVVQALMGPLLQRIADATPAALSLSTAHASLPFAFDEAEPAAAWILELLSLMRISSGGEGKRIRVDMQTGGIKEQTFRFSALLSNVSAPSMSRADASRMVPINLGDEVENWHAVRDSITSAMGAASGVRSSIIREAAAIAAKVDEQAQEMQGLGMDSREALASAALTAGWHWWGIETKDKRTDVYSTDAYHDRDRTDAEDCLRSIMEMTIRDPGGAGKTLAKALTKDPGAIADLFAIRYDGLAGLMVRYGHRGLKDGLRGTAWEKADLRSMLLQLEGATITNPLSSIGSQRGRCLNIPYATLIKAGIEIGEAE